MSDEVKVKLGFEGHPVETTFALEAGELAPWGLESKLNVVEKRHARVDGLAKATGRALYTHDRRLPGMLYGAILRSPFAAAKVKKIDLDGAKSIAGVKAAIVVDRGGRAKDRVYFEGEEIAAVAAISRDVAQDALAKISVEWEPLPFVVDVATASQDGAPQVFPRRPNVAEGEERKRGDPDAAIDKTKADGGAVVEATYATQVQTHSALETHGVVASWEDDGTLTVYASTQGTFSVRDGLADHFRMRPSSVRVISEHVGGGFGAKFGPGVEGVVAARLAKDAKAPVHLMLDRREEHLASGNRPDSIQEMRGAISKDGKITALVVRSSGTGGVAGGAAGVANPMIYDVANTAKLERHVLTNAGGARAFRAPGHPQGSFALESMIDELALAVGIDPLEVRKKNDKSPIRLHEWELGAKAIGWAEKRNKNPGVPAAGSSLVRGVGCAAAVWGGQGGPPATVIVNVDEDGAVEARSGVQDIGTGTRTVLACVVAEELGLEGPSKVRVAMGDTRDPFGPGSGGSRTAASVGPAARVAAAKARLDIAAAMIANMPWMGVPPKPDAFTFENGKVNGPGLGDGMPFAKAIKLTKKKGFTASGDRGRNTKGFGGGVCGCQFAEVEVDLETGSVRVVRVVAVQDMGTIIDRLTAESQVIGAVIQGVSYALFEERIMDPKTGRMVNADFLNYKILAPGDCPEITPILVPVRAGVNECSMLGVGEPPTIPTSGAIANAVANATGVRVRSLPITPAKVLAALDAARRSSKKFR